MKQGLFEVFGNGELGLKADDLNRYRETIADAGMTIPEGIVIATGIFDQLAEHFNLAEGIPPEDIEKHSCPRYLRSINKEILDRMEAGRPYAIRSSALSESGGTGIYKSTFFWPKGDRARDAKELWASECAVYASEFSKNARLWRERNHAPKGMAILIQPVPGFCFPEGFLPPLSGIAYTSYHGLPMTQTVVGLGTRAVKGEGVVHHEPTDHLIYELQRQDSADVITPEGIVEISADYDEIWNEIAPCSEAHCKLFASVVELGKQQGLYLEWAIYQGQIFVVQCAPFEDRLPGNLSLDGHDYLLLLKGNDVFGSGYASCKGVVFVRNWEPKTQRMLEHLNETTKDFLLIVPQEASSTKFDFGVYDPESSLEFQRLGFSHFSNSLAVIERQGEYSESDIMNMKLLGIRFADHSQGRGASHFSQLCNRMNILFIGAKFDLTPLFNLPGAMDYGEGVGITLWDTAAEVVVDETKKEGFVYVSKRTERKDYSLNQVREYVLSLRAIANQISDSGNYKLANCFYAVHYAIGHGDDPLRFDPFALDKEVVEKAGGPEKFIEGLNLVLASGPQCVANGEWNGGLKDYLERLLAHLTK